MVALIVDRSSSKSAISSKEKMASDKFSRLSVLGGRTNAHRTHPQMSGAMVPLRASLTLATVSLGPCTIILIKMFNFQIMLIKFLYYIPAES